uniref:Coatomer subunit zeta n=3 Tax=Esox lucius TaxID=8010 RepID=A0A3P9A498_ESOLU
MGECEAQFRGASRPAEDPPTSESEDFARSTRMTAQTCPRQHQRTTMEIASLEPSLYTVKAVFILDNDGNRLLSKYYDTELYPSMKEQKNFEKNVFNKTHKADNEIAFLEGMTIVYKSSIDLFFYVVGSAQENELMLMAVLNCLFESLSQVLRKNVEKRCLLDNLDGVFLVVDEIIDGGVILESDPQQVIQKVNYRLADSEQAYGFVLFDYITGSADGRTDGRQPVCVATDRPVQRPGEGARGGGRMRTHCPSRAWLRSCSLPRNRSSGQYSNDLR